MPPKKSISNKTQQLTLRIDDKTRFQLDFCARITGMSVTTFVERAIQEKASDVDINEEYEGTTGRQLDQNLTWAHFWDPDEGMRTIKMFTTSGMTQYMKYEEEQILLFMKEYWNYIAYDPDLNKLSRAHVNVLWRHIAEIAPRYRVNKKTAPNKAIELFDEKLKQADLEPVVPF